jgi:hypothetical protein
MRSLERRPKKEEEEEEEEGDRSDVRFSFVFERWANFAWSGAG